MSPSRGAGPELQVPTPASVPPQPRPLRVLGFWFSIRGSDNLQTIKIPARSLFVLMVWDEGLLSREVSVSVSVRVCVSPLLDRKATVFLLCLFQAFRHGGSCLGCPLQPVYNSSSIRLVCRPAAVGTLLF